MRVSELSSAELSRLGNKVKGSDLRLDVGDLAPGELELVERHLGLFEVAQEAELLGPQDEQGVAPAALAARRPPHAVDVLARLVRRIELTIHPCPSHISSRQGSHQSTNQTKFHSLPWWKWKRKWPPFQWTSKGSSVPGRSSRRRGCRDRGPPRPCRATCPTRRYKTGRRSSFASSASACPAPFQTKFQTKQNQVALKAPLIGSTIEEISNHKGPKVKKSSWMLWPLYRRFQYFNFLKWTILGVLFMFQFLVGKKLLTWMHMTGRSM